MNKPSSSTDQTLVTQPEQHRQFCFIIVRFVKKAERSQPLAPVSDITFIIESKKFTPLSLAGSGSQTHSYLSSATPEKVPLMASSKQNSDLAEICVLCLQFC